jgi:tetratricopeptide (TPR) repeat protein
MADKNKGVANSRNSDRRMTQKPAPHAPTQLAAFEAAMKLFHERRLTEARVLFQQAVAGAERDVAQRAQLHIAMCDRRLQQPKVSLATAEENYNYGVALLNARNFVEARTHLEKALALAPGSDHIHYALALSLALSGAMADAHDHLRRAIELDPRNRQLARQDADFAPLAHQAPFRSLIYPDKNGW